LPAGEERIRVQESESTRRLAARIGGEMVEFSAVDNRYQAADQISFLRIEFRRQDQDKNGYLGPEEFAALGVTGASFDEIDLDKDGQLFMNELDRFIRLDTYRAQSFAEMTIDAIDKPLFQILDENLDRRLSQREFKAGLERVQPYDRDEDGSLEAGELLALRKYRVAFSFGVPPAVRIERQNQMDSSRRLPVVQQQTSGPEWLRKMDRNQDGDLTWREFLGPRQAFDRLDRDGSGWIDEDEAEG
jgi:Ca2+-binding EF-hand superfamily protein